MADELCAGGVMIGSEAQDQLAIALHDLQKKAARATNSPVDLSSDDGLATTLKWLRRQCADKGLAISHDVHTRPRAEVGVSTRLVHISGQWMESTPFLLPYKGDSRRVVRLCSVISLLGVMGLIALEDMRAIAAGDQQ